MADQASPIQQIAAGSNALDRVNENFDVASPAMLWGRDARTTGGLTWGFVGGRWGGAAIPSGTVALTAGATSYVVANRVSGAVSASTNTTAWADQAAYVRLYRVTAGASSVTDYEDHRQAIGGSASSGGGLEDVIAGAGIAIDKSDPRNPVISAAGGGGGGSDSTTMVGAFGLWTAAKARGAANPARLAIVGDSNIAGEGAGAGPRALTGAAALSLGHRLADLLGCQDYASFFGDQNVTIAPAVALGTYDPRITLGSGWAPDATESVIFGGRFLRAAAGASGLLSFAPGVSISRFRVWYPTLDGLNTAVTVYVDGSAVETFSQVGTAGLTHKDYTVSAGAHTITIGVGSSGDAYVAGVECWDGSATPVALIGGYCNARAGDLSSIANPWSPRPGTVAMAPDYTIIYCTINDLINSTAQDVYYGQVEALVAALTGSNGCLCMGYPPDNTRTTSGPYDQMAVALRNIAADHGWSYYDCRRDVGRSSVTAAARGVKYDTLHPNAAGAAAIAAGLAGFLTTAGI